MKSRLTLLICCLHAGSPLAAQPSIISSASSEWVSLKKEPLTAPIISWQAPAVKQVIEHGLTATVKVRVQAVDAMTRLQFIRNGIELNRETRGFKREGGVEFSEVIPLVAGANEIYVKATNAIGSSKSEPRIIICQPDSAQLVVTVPKSSAQKRLALVVANGNYGRYPLRNPTNDGKAVKQQLETLGFTVIYKENQPLRELKHTFDAFMTELGTHNVGLFYYAGHGLMVGGENYVQPVDADPRAEPDVEFECYPLRQIVARMAYANARGTNLVFWDACRNNPYRSWRRGGSEPMFAPVQPAVGTMIVFATEPGKQSYDGDGQNGLFTSELLKHMNQPNVDIFELVDRIDQGLEERGFKQPPYLEGRLRGKFMFKAN
ncbi:caspase domain-containing protein [uncultured Fibrella sp.]|uniref:caspase family protein n=1 Tax=uncultured Fibrella sp. TaxID=1284596 RepID=UPI0035C99BEC